MGDPSHEFLPEVVFTSAGLGAYDGTKPEGAL